MFLEHYYKDFSNAYIDINLYSSRLHFNDK